MKTSQIAAGLGFGFAAALVPAAQPVRTGELTLVTLAPGHFHAALFQREPIPGIADEAHVYAPLGPDLTAHLNRVAGFNLREDNPTRWRLHVYAGADYQERMLRERPGQIAVISGRNRGKIDRITGCVRAGLHVLADKPWIIEAADMARLEAALDAADSAGVIAYDAMTARFEITNILARAFATDPDVFGRLAPGSPAEPAVFIDSMHYLLKEVAGVPNLRPPWFFDVAEQGEGLTDVGTHLVDTAHWTLFPDQAIDHRTDIRVRNGRRWPTKISPAEFQRVTAEREFPENLRTQVRDGHLDYYCNTEVDYTLRGSHVRLRATWEFAAPPGKKDTELVIFRGARACIEVRQGAEQSYRREVYVVPNTATERAPVFAAARRRVAALQDAWPGVALEEEQGARLHVVIPERFRVGHEEHFALVTRRFLGYVQKPHTLPAWEKPNMLTKYHVTTAGVRLARQAAGGH